MNTRKISKIRTCTDDIDNQLKEITKDKQGNAVFISHESLGYRRSLWLCSKRNSKYEC